MLLKGLLEGRVAAQAPRTSAPHVKPVASRRHAAFKGARALVVRAQAEAEAPKAAAAVSLESITAGQKLEGTVVSMEEYGAFVDVGAASPGLVHISKLAAGFTKNVKDVLSVGQKVTVNVLNVDAAKGRISLALLNAEGVDRSVVADAAPEEEDFDAPRMVDDRDAEGAQDDEDEEVEVELEDGQVEVYADLPGYDDVPFIMEENDVAEFDELSLATMEQDLDEVEIKYELDSPAYMEEVTGKVTRIEEFGMFLEFQWQGKTLNGLLTKDEMKVPTDLVSEEDKEELRAEWAETPYEMPMFAPAPEGPDFDIKKYYQPGQEVPAFVLESALIDAKGINLTHYTDEDIAAEAVDLIEAADEDEEEELEDLMAQADALEAEPLAFDPEDILEEAEDDADGRAAMLAASSREEGAADVLNFSLQQQDDAVDNYEEVAFAGAALRGKNGSVVMPMGLPSRPIEAYGRPASLSTSITDFEGDDVQLYDFWSSDLVDNMPKDILKKMGLKMTWNEAGDAEFTPREDHVAERLPLAFLPTGESVEELARSLVEDLLDDDVEEAEVPARACRRPIVLAAAVANISAGAVKALRDKTGAGMMDCKKALTECSGNEEEAAEWLRKKGLSGADKKAGRIAAEGAISRYIHPGSRLGVLLEVNCETDFVAASEKFNALVNELGMIIASTDCICVSPEDVPAEFLAKEREVEMGKEDLANKPEAIRAKIVEGRMEKLKTSIALLNQPALSDPNKTVADLVKATIAAVGENIKIRRFIKYRLGEGLEKRTNDFAAEVAQQTQAKAAAPAKPKEEPKKEEPKAAAKPVVAVAASVVKALRDKTGAGMMDCKKALGECENDMDKAVEWLRMKGLAGADKKAGRIAAEGVIACYIHPGSRLGVLLEVNCETDFVAASEKFNQLVNYIAMGIVAGQGVQYVSAEDIPAEVFEREKQIEMGREDLKSKPDAIRAKIAEGRVKKLAQDMALLDQPFLTDPTKTVAEAIKESIAAIGEKISVRRFVKFQLGEGLEKKSNDFAAEVAAVTGQK